MASYFVPLLKTAGQKPMYVWMWTTGIFFFLVTFLEQNLWQLPWFRESYLREVTVQWKANGSMVGAWNQMIYGTSLYLMVKISGDETIARGKTAFFFYMLGLTNLMFNWGHHLYNVPAASWIRDTSYIISMTEWVFFIRMIQGFKKTLEDRRKYRHLITYRFIIAGEFWVFMNLLLTLAMSVPAVNRYTHGTHITVAHAMGATIGINSMLLLASFTYMLGIERKSELTKKAVGISYWVTQYSLGVFWLCLIVAGVIKAYGSTVRNLSSFQEIMQPVMPAITAFSVSGIFLMSGLGAIAVIYLYHTVYYKDEMK
jgi:nitric oxide reductase subunit B